MFFSILRRNSQKSRKENWIYFTSLVIAILAFYTILSLESQDVMVFLKTVESDAVARMLSIIGVLYLLSLFFLFFMVYFSNKYQLLRRSKELGLYQMLGMSGKRLFTMLMGETFLNSLVAMALGLPIAVFLTEGISLVTAKVVGLGIIGHRFNISFKAVGLTALGFFAVQFIAMAVLSAKITHTQPGELLMNSKEKEAKPSSPKKSVLILITGVLCLLVAYGLGIVGVNLPSIYYPFGTMALILMVFVWGIVGTFLFFKGLGVLVGRRAFKQSQKATGLTSFTFRQVEENVFRQHSALAISSLLMVMAFLCLGFGFFTIVNKDDQEPRSVDITIETTMKTEEVSKWLASDELAPYIKAYYPMAIKLMDVPHKNQEGKIINKDAAHTFSWGSFRQVYNQKLTENEKTKDTVYKMTDKNNDPYLIPLSSYNQMLTNLGKPPIILLKNQGAIFSDPLFAYDTREEALKENTFVVIDGEQFYLLPTLYTDKPLADRAITLDYGLIVADDDFKRLIPGYNENLSWNVLLQSELIEQQGLMQGMMEAENAIKSSFEGDWMHINSYLKTIGRKLFYAVAASYGSLYMAILFLLIANTVLGLKFLMEQERTKRRYQILSLIGAEKKALIKSANKQSLWLFALVIGTALVSGIVGTIAMVGLYFGIEILSISLWEVLIPIIGAIAVFGVIELFYIGIIKKASAQQIRKVLNNQL